MKTWFLLLLLFNGSLAGARERIHVMVEIKNEKLRNRIRNDLPLGLTGPLTQKYLAHKVSAALTAALRVFEFSEEPADTSYRLVVILRDETIPWPRGRVVMGLRLERSGDGPEAPPLAATKFHGLEWKDAGPFALDSQDRVSPDPFWVEGEPLYLTRLLESLILTKGIGYDEQTWHLLSQIRIRADAPAPWAAQWTTEGIITRLSYDDVGHPSPPDAHPQSIFELRNSQTGARWLFVPCFKKEGKLSGLPVNRLSVQECSDALPRSQWPRETLGSKWESIFLAGCIR